MQPSVLDWRILERQRAHSPAVCRTELDGPLRLPKGQPCEMLGHMPVCFCTAVTTGN